MLTAFATIILLANLRGPEAQAMLRELAGMRAPSTALPAAPRERSALPWATRKSAIIDERLDRDLAERGAKAVDLQDHELSKIVQGYSGGVFGSRRLRIRHVDVRRAIGAARKAPK